MNLLDRAVGHGARHCGREDARTVRLLLNANLARINDARAKSGTAALPPLPERGHFTRAEQLNLIERIGEFQSRLASPGKEVDKRVDPGGETERALLKGLSQGLTVTNLKIIIPEAPDPNVAMYAPQLARCMDEYEIDTPLRQAHFIAQLAVESDRLKTAKEYASGDEYEDRDDLGNTEEGDGKKFKGRGLIQITGRSNYAAFADFYDIELTGPKDGPNRERLSNDPSLAAVVSCWFWMEHKLNKWADADSVLNVSKVVNAGSVHVRESALHGYHERQHYLRRAKAVLLPTPDR